MNQYRARAYHPVLGRFMSEDPKGFDAGDYNLFRYCGNDPEDKVDPSGMVAGIFVPSEWGFRATGQGSVRDGRASSGGSSPAAAQAGGRSDATEVEVDGLNMSPSGQGRSQAEYENSPTGKVTDKGAPNALVQVGNSAVKGGADYTLQAARISGTGDHKKVTLLHGEIASKENVSEPRVTTTSGKISVKQSQTTNGKWVPGAQGQITDHVTAKIKSDKGASGEITKQQSYTIWYEGNKYVMPTQLEQRHVIENGRVTESLLNITGGQ